MSNPHVAYGLLPTGFVRRTFDELKLDLQERFIQAFGVNINLDPQSPQGQLIDNIAALLHESWETAEDIYQSFDIRAATGSRLDVLASLSGQPVRNLNESDEDYRFRILSFRQTTTNLTEDLIASLRSLDLVENVAIKLNETNNIIDDIPANSYSAIVLGGDDLEIANVIWKTHPAGITSFGNTSVEILDDFGFCRNVNFTRPSVIDIEVILNVSFVNNSEACNVLSSDEIKDLFLSKTNSSDKNTFGFKIFKSWIEGLLIDTNNLLIESSLIRILGEVDFVENIILNFDEIANFSKNNLTVNIL